MLGYIGAWLTGVILGLMGGGGSILIVPVLVYLFGVRPSLATAYSLFLVGIVSLIGVLRYSRQGLVSYRTAISFAAPSFVGVFAARRFILPVLPENIWSWGDFVLSKDALIMITFAMVMLAASFSMIRSRSPQHTPAGPSSIGALKYLGIALSGFVIGLVTGFVGVGGGFLITPALVVFVKIPMRTAIGTSLVVIAINSLLGFVGDLGGHLVMDWSFLLALTAMASLGIWIGTSLSRFVPAGKLKPAFGWFVFIMGGFILVQQLL